MPRCVGLTRKRYSTLNLTLFWIRVPTRTKSLSWVTSMLPRGLRELATSYVLDPMALVSGIPTALSFWILQNPDDWELQVLGIRDQSCTAGLGIAMPEGQLRRSITSSLVLVGGSFRTAGFTECRVLCNWPQAYCCNTQASCQVQKDIKMWSQCVPS